MEEKRQPVTTGMWFGLRHGRVAAPQRPQPAMVILDKTGKVIATSNDGKDPEAPFSWARRNPQAVTVASAALAGETNPSSLFLRTMDGSTVTAVPVLGSDHSVLGALIEAFPNPPGLGGLLHGLLSWRNAILVVLVAAFVGALFGFLTARWLTRRLRLLAAATDGWGRGDFSAMVSDRSGDEIGELARRLDCTAGQVQELLRDREQLAVIEEERVGLSTEFRADGVGSLPPETEQGLYRIAQEALNNALKHARPNRISVRLRKEGKELIMEIMDDGTGFVPEEPKNQRGWACAVWRKEHPSWAGAWVS